MLGVSKCGYGCVCVCVWVRGVSMEVLEFQSSRILEFPPEKTSEDEWTAQYRHRKDPHHLFLSIY